MKAPRTSRKAFPAQEAVSARWLAPGGRADIRREPCGNCSQLCDRACPGAEQFSTTYLLREVTGSSRIRTSAHVQDAPLARGGRGDGLQLPQQPPPAGLAASLGQAPTSPSLPAPGTAALLLIPAPAQPLPSAPGMCPGAWPPARSHAVSSRSKAQLPLEAEEGVEGFGADSQPLRCYPPLVTRDMLQGTRAAAPAFAVSPGDPQLGEKETKRAILQAG